MPMELKKRSSSNRRECGSSKDEGTTKIANDLDEDIDVSGILTHGDGSRKNLEDSMKSDLTGDGRNIAILLLLYVLQGIPLGLGAAVPLILTNRHVSYKQQAEFSFAYWPFSFKLLWAPIVDSVYVTRFGRRKTWLVPVQYLIGVTMLVLAQTVDYYLNGEGNESRTPDVFKLTFMFFVLNFLAATQDVAVDGWALTMLQRRNVGYASTANSVGQTAGYFLGYVGYMVLESYGLVTLKSFLNFWGIIFIVATTLVAIFKHDKSSDAVLEHSLDHEELGVLDTYKILFKIVALPLMPAMIVFLLTSKVGFSAADAVSSLKLIESGVPKEKLAMLAVPLMPLQILLPWVISRYTNGPKPMTVFLKAMPPRLLIGLLFAVFVYVTPYFQLENGDFPWYYYAVIVGVYMVHQVFVYSMFVSLMAFFANISDPAVGGTYMTLLNTLTNLGGNWPATLALWWVDVLTWKRCDNYSMTSVVQPLNTCDNAEQVKDCQEYGGVCVTEIEGYYVESVVCVVISFLWLFLWGWKVAHTFQAAELEEWKVVGRKERIK